MSDVPDRGWCPWPQSPPAENRSLSWLISNLTRLNWSGERNSVLCFPLSLLFYNSQEVCSTTMTLTHTSGSHFVLALLHPLLHRPYQTLQWDVRRFLTGAQAGNEIPHSNPNCFPLSSIVFHVSRAFCKSLAVCCFWNMEAKGDYIYYSRYVTFLNPLFSFPTFLFISVFSS